VSSPPPGLGGYVNPCAFVKFVSLVPFPRTVTRLGDCAADWVSTSVVASRKADSKPEHSVGGLVGGNHPGWWFPPRS
jgi:hypothetical protein